MTLKGPSWLRSSLLGAACGLAGALLAHWAVLALRMQAENANLWLKGPHGPPFFELALSTGIYYACTGAGAGIKRLHGAAAGLGASFLAVALPMVLATQALAWGEDPEEPETLAWFYLVLGCYALANVLGSAAAGFFSAEPRSRRAAAGAVLGCAGAGLLHILARVLFPAESLVLPALSLLPPKSALAVGALWGGMMSAGADWGGHYGKGNR